MWTCRNCSAESEVAPEACPVCGTVDVELTAADGSATTLAETIDDEGPTEYDVHPLPDLQVVECYIGVTEAEASAVAAKLRDLGIPVYLDHEPVDDGKAVHKVRVPFVDLTRALAAIDHIVRRRATRH